LTIHADHLDTPRQLTDNTKKVVWNWAYSAFGENQPTNINSTVFNLRYPGQYYDAESKLHYNINRYYDPATGRYTQSDPIGLAGGINTYTYVGGNSIRWSDPWGLAVETPWDAANVALGIGSAVANIATGNYGAAAVDALGVVVDIAATATPGVPGGAAAGIKAARCAGQVGDVAKTVRNGHLAGGSHPKTGVPFDKNGFPDFSKHLYKGGINDVKITPTGSRGSINQLQIKQRVINQHPKVMIGTIIKTQVECN
jgi:RHS repeat-associated protein